MTPVSEFGDKWMREHYSDDIGTDGMAGIVDAPRDGWEFEPSPEPDGDQRNSQHPDDPGADEPPDDDPGHVTHSAQLGVAYHLADLHKDRLLHVHSIGWHHWDGTRWKYDDTGAAQRAVYTTRALWIEALRADKKRRKAIVNDIERCETANGVLGVLTLARALPEFAATVRDLDADPWLLNCANGTLDLRTMKLSPHNPADRITRIPRTPRTSLTPAAPSGSSSYERILPDGDVRGYLQRIIGLSLLGEVNGDKQLAPIGYGGGANGKTTFSETVCHALGDYASAAARVCSSCDAATYTPQDKPTCSAAGSLPQQKPSKERISISRCSNELPAAIRSRRASCAKTSSSSPHRICC